MIATLRGKIVGVTDQAVIIDVHGVGFSVITTPALRLSAQAGGDIFLHTALVVREDGFTLFGYQSMSERDLFQLLQTVSGIGPKVSHAVLGALSLEEIIRAIRSEDSKSLEKVSGLGKKGAQRIILELKEKVISFGEPATKSSNMSTPGALSLAQALTGLGFSSREIEHALDVVKDSATTTIEDQLKTALAALTNGGPRV